MTISSDDTNAGFSFWTQLTVCLKCKLVSKCAKIFVFFHKLHHLTLYFCGRLNLGSFLKSMSMSFVFVTFICKNDFSTPELWGHDLLFSFEVNLQWQSSAYLKINLSALLLWHTFMCKMNRRGDNMREERGASGGAALLDRVPLTCTLCVLLGNLRSSAQGYCLSRTVPWAC